MQSTHANWPGSKLNASFFLPFLIAFSRRFFLTDSGVSKATGEKKKKRYIPCQPLNIQLLGFTDLQLFPSGGEEYDGKYKTKDRIIPVFSPLCTSLGLIGHLRDLWTKV